MANDCSICSSTASVRRAVDNSLRNGERLRDIAARSGFSKSAVHRHSQRCSTRQILASRKAMIDENGRLLVKWPTAAEHPYVPAEVAGKILDYDVEVQPNQVNSDDILLVVEYAKPLQPAAQPVPDTKTNNPQ